MKLVSNVAVGSNTVDVPEIKKSKSLPAIIPPKVDAPKPEPEPDFDWSTDDSVVLHRQPSIAIYINGAGGLVIRQERAWDQDEDTFIVVAAENIDRFVDELTDRIGIPSFGSKP